MGAALRTVSADAEPGPEEEPVRTEEERLDALIASKQERLAALETEQDEYRRVRAHLGDLMAHNMAAMERAVEEIENLTALKTAAGLIRSALKNG